MICVIRGSSVALANDAFVDARFTDHCLEKPVFAESLYERALESEPKLTAKERGECEFAIARARGVDGRLEAATTVLERLVEKSGDQGYGPWPGRAREMLARIGAGENPFLADPRGRTPLTVECAAKPLLEVLRDIGGKTGVSFTLDPSCPDRWTVSAYLLDLTLEEMLDKLVGQSQWRRIGDDGIVIGDIAANGAAFERGWPWSAVEDRPSKALGARLCTARASLTFPGIPLSEALGKFNALGVCEASVAPAFADRIVRVYAKDLRLDHALDMLAVPLGLTWTVAGGKVVLLPRKEKAE